MKRFSTSTTIPNSLLISSSDTFSRWDTWSAADKGWNQTYPLLYRVQTLVVRCMEVGKRPRGVLGCMWKVFVPRACPQLRHGSLRLAACCCRSIRVADGGFGFFHPLHLQVSLAWEQVEYDKHRVKPLKLWLNCCLCVTKRFKHRGSWWQIHGKISCE